MHDVLIPLFAIMSVFTPIIIGIFAWDYWEKRQMKKAMPIKLGIVKRTERLALAVEFEVSVNTVDRWIYGTAIPHPRLQKQIKKFLAELRKKK